MNYYHFSELGKLAKLRVILSNLDFCAFIASDFGYINLGMIDRIKREAEERFFTACGKELETETIIFPFRGVEIVRVKQ